MPLAKAQRGDAIQFAAGICDLFAGDDTDLAEAAAINVARVLTLIGNVNSEGRFSKE